MRIHRFFIEQKIASEADTGVASKVRNVKVKIENDELVHQWRNVLRFQVGQEVILYDNSGTEFHAVLTALTNRSAEVEITSSKSGNFAPKRELFLHVALPKRDSFEWILEKGTELGVTAFAPVISERSEKKEINLARSKNLLKEACEQSGRAVLPEIFEPVLLAEALESEVVSSAISAHCVFILDPTGESLSLAEFKNSKRVHVFTGPEGGFSQTELDLFISKGIPIRSFSTQILRAETAAAAISSILLLDF